MAVKVQFITETHWVILQVQKTEIKKKFIKKVWVKHFNILMKY